MSQAPCEFGVDAMVPRNHRVSAPPCLCARCLPSTHMPTVQSTVVVDMVMGGILVEGAPDARFHVVRRLGRG